jgi:hypothetical protein
LSLSIRELRKVAFGFKDLKSRDLKNNFSYKWLDINLTTHVDVNFGDFVQTKILVVL